MKIFNFHEFSCLFFLTCLFFNSFKDKKLYMYCCTKPWLTFIGIIYLYLLEFLNLYMTNLTLQLLEFTSRRDKYCNKILNNKLWFYWKLDSWILLQCLNFWPFMFFLCRVWEFLFPSSKKSFSTSIRRHFGLSTFCYCLFLFSYSFFSSYQLLFYKSSR